MDPSNSSNYLFPLLNGNITIKQLLLVSIVPDFFKKILEILFKEISTIDIFTPFIKKILIFLKLKKIEYKKQLSTENGGGSKYIQYIQNHIKTHNIIGTQGTVRNDREVFYDQPLQLTKDISLIISEVKTDSKVAIPQHNYQDIFTLITNDEKALNDFIQVINETKTVTNTILNNFYVGQYNGSDIDPYSNGNGQTTQKKKIKCSGTIHFEYYTIKNSKNFDNLFISNKQSILTILDNFKNSNGIYKFPNIDHKLGILLYGPPGTGKTSFIKCISNYFNRHIVSVPITALKTNRLFFKFIMDSHKNVREGYNTTNHDLYFKDVIYLIEDIDAINSVIKTRQPTINEGTPIVIPEEEEIYEDQLNLAGILNTLDGILDSPDRIIVFTTNHIEHIDPALIRPGRIDLKIKLDNLQPKIAIEMIEYYFNKIEEPEIFIKYFTEHSTSPAVLEKYIKQSTSITELYNLLINSQNETS